MVMCSGFALILTSLAAVRSQCLRRTVRRWLVASLQMYETSWRRRDLAQLSKQKGEHRFSRPLNTCILGEGKSGCSSCLPSSLQALGALVALSAFRPARELGQRHSDSWGAARQTDRERQTDQTDRQQGAPLIREAPISINYHMLHCILSPRGGEYYSRLEDSRPDFKGG